MTMRILIAEDEEVLCANLCEFLQRSGFDVDGVGDGEAALAKLLETDYFLLISDLRMPKMDGVSLLKRVQAERPETFVLITTAYASVDTAIDALRYGAYDYLTKPIVFAELLQKVKNLILFKEMKEELNHLRRLVQTNLTDNDLIVGESPATQQLLALIEKVAPTQSTVLISGESGTGKELVARALHRLSKHSTSPFLAINMATVPPDMAEAQLFGHERGAFTGAVQRREGLFRSAKGGTVFLDEVGEMSLSVQAKLLRTLENNEVIPVGSDRAVKANFRLVAATNRDLEQQVSQGLFRQDLFFRLNVLGIKILPLRERREDVSALANHMLQKHNRSCGKTKRGFSNEAMRVLVSYHWPGNVRELSNVIERAVILSDGETITPEDLPADLVSQEPLPMCLKHAVAEAEKRHIQWVLSTVDGNREKAAKLLEIDRATLYRRLDKYQVK